MRGLITHRIGPIMGLALLLCWGGVACRTPSDGVPMSAPRAEEMRKLTLFSSLAYMMAPERGLLVAATQGVFFIPDGPAEEVAPRYITLGWRAPSALAEHPEGWLVGLDDGEIFLMKNPLARVELDPLGRVPGRVYALYARQEGEETALYAGSSTGLFKREKGAWVDLAERFEQPAMRGGVIWLFEDPLVPGSFYAQVGKPDQVLYDIGDGIKAHPFRRRMQEYHSMFVDKTWARLYAPTPVEKEFHILAVFLASNINPASQSLASLHIAPADPSLVYVGINCCGSRRVTRKGFMWRADNKGPKGQVGLAMVTDPDNAQRVFLGSPEGVFRSENGGDDWVALYKSKATKGRRIAGRPGVGLSQPVKATSRPVVSGH